jgi:hypothetical protein
MIIKISNLYMTYEVGNWKIIYYTTKNAVEKTLKTSLSIPVFCAVTSTHKERTSYKDLKFLLSYSM